MANAPSLPPQLRRRALGELAQIFLKLGTIGFGGPQAHMALMNDELVVRRQWFSPEEFSEGLALCEMLPGPASTQLGIYSGYLRAGQMGALVAGFCFIAPAFGIVVVLSWGYFRFQDLPQLDALFFGISPVVVAIVLAFCWKLGKKSIRSGWDGAIALTLFLLTLLTPLSLILQFLLAGLIGILRHRPKTTTALIPLVASPAMFRLPLAPILLTLPPETLSLASFWGTERLAQFALPLALFFLKVGSFIFGGGLVIIPLLEAEIVHTLHWLTPQEFINGVAIGQLSPGPVVLTAAFVGYKVAGFWGALVAAIAIFTPSFAFIMVAAPLLRRLRQNTWVRAFVQGVTPGVLGAIAAATFPLIKTAVGLPTLGQSAIAVCMGLAALIGLIRYKLPTWQLVPLGAIAGLLIDCVLQMEF